MLNCDIHLNLEELPLILAGPILRRTESEAVTVWLALTELCSVTVKVYATEGGMGATLGKLLLSGQRSTVPLGQHLYLVAVTAKPIGDYNLESGQIYAYDLYFGSSEENLATVLRTKDSECNLSYFSHQLPTFSLPSDDLNHLRLVHGSCRKPHGGGRDTLSCLDNLIQESAHLANERPPQLLLTGDQIYADDVATPFLWLARAVGNLLLGWEEDLPLKQGAIAPSQLPLGQRSEIARREGGFTAMLGDQPEKAKNHLFSFGEYAAAYLLAWSPVLMPDRFPAGKSLFNNSKQAQGWEREIRATESFIRDLGRVRRALANIPTYTICDDHDISDDWYLNRQWCDRVLSKPLGRRVVQNGLLAYALFQAWGNTPEQFEEGHSGNKLLQVAAQWSASAGRDVSASEEIARYLGIPPIDGSTGLPKLQRDEDVLILARDSQAVPWHYSIRSFKHEVIVLDTRTWRGYPLGEERGTDPPMLLCPTAFRQQLQAPLEQTDWLNQSGQAEIEATVVILPTNLVTLSVIDAIQHWELTRNRVFSNDVGDSWNFHQEAWAKLLLSLCQRRERVVILSGDIHYSCAVRLTHWFRSPARTSVLVQLTSSAIKNSEWATRLIHTKLKLLLPEPTEHWLGWQEPLRLVKLPQANLWQRIRFFSNESDSIQQTSPPDWQYRIEWSERQPAQLVPWRQRSTSFNNQTQLWQRIVGFLVSWLWRNPWLQEGVEVVGRNNLSVVKFKWSPSDEAKAVIQETYWYSPWNSSRTVKSCYFVALKQEPPPSLPPAK